MIKKYISIMIVSSLLVVVLTACGQKKMISEGDWRTTGFHSMEGQMTESTPVGHTPDESEYVEIKYFSPDDPTGAISAYTSNKRFVIYEREPGQYALETQDSNLKKSIVDLFTDTEGLDQAGVICMDAVQDSLLTLLCVQGEEYYLVNIDSKGNFLSKTTVTKGYQELYAAGFTIFPDAWWCDGEGNTYILTEQAKKLIVINGEGKPVKTKDYTNEQYKQYMTAFHAPDGSLIFSVTDTESLSSVLIQYSTEDWKEKELARFEQTCMRQFLMPDEETIYYSRNGRLWKWNIKSGEQEEIYNYAANAIPDNFDRYVSHVVIEGKKILVYIANGTRTDVCVLSNEVQETKEEIQFLNFAGIASSYTKSRAASFSRVEGNTVIKFEEITGEEEDAWNLALAEFVAGKGPDIICFTENNEKLQTLYEKGLLADMTEFIPKETQNQIFPAIVKSGKIGEDWVALIPEATGKSLLVSNQLWEKEHWELEDILHISESNEQTEGLTINTYFKSKASFVLETLVFDSFENSPFIDMDNHESHFEDELFQKLLETAKLQGQESKIIGENEVKDLVKNGNYVVLDFNSGSMNELVKILNNYGDACHTVGYPGQSEGIGYWLPSYVIAVNKNTKHKEEISAFLQFLLEGDCQVLSNYMPVREDVIRENVFYDEWSVPPAWYYRAQMEKGMRGGTAISNPNGDSYLEEIIQYLNNLGVYETAPESIRNIITNETEDFFSGARDAKQVADAIDNRVQLYLDEQN